MTITRLTFSVIPLLVVFMSELLKSKKKEDVSLRFWLLNLLVIMVWCLQPPLFSFLLFYSDLEALIIYENKLMDKQSIIIYICKLFLNSKRMIILHVQCIVCIVQISLLKQTLILLLFTELINFFYFLATSSASTTDAQYRYNDNST